MRFVFPLIFLGLCLNNFASAASTPVIDGPVIDPANGHTYYLLDTDTWSNSQAEAQALGGNLATLDNAAENTWVYDTFGPTVASLDGDLWIGLYDPIIGDGTGAQHAANFSWVDGSTSTYRDWNSGEPNNDSKYGGEYYADITGYNHNGLTPGKWNDKNENGSGNIAYGVVEVVPEPTTAAILLPIGVALRRRRRQSRIGSDAKASDGTARKKCRVRSGVGC